MALNTPFGPNEANLDVYILVRALIMGDTTEFNTIGDRYKFVDDSISRIYGLRKKGKERTLDFIRYKVLQIDDKNKIERLKNELLSYWS